jgi:hypothetical protein
MASMIPALYDMMESCLLLEFYDDIIQEKKTKG